MGSVERHREGVLDHHTDDNHRWRNPVVCLCSAHMVLVLPDGYDITLGGSEKGAAAEGVHACQGEQQVRDEMQDVCTCLPDAAHSIRCPRRGDRLSAWRLPEMQQVCEGLSYEDYGAFQYVRLTQK